MRIDETIYKAMPAHLQALFAIEQNPARDEVLAGFPGEADGSAARFFYCAKADRAERNAGCEQLPARNWSSGEQSPGTFQSENTNRKANNFHPTVKPVALMQYLIRLVTPKGGTVLDPFSGSGSTGIAAQREQVDAILIEREADYVAIAEARIRAESPLFAHEVEVAL